MDGNLSQISVKLIYIRVRDMEVQQLQTTMTEVRYRRQMKSLKKPKKSLSPTEFRFPQISRDSLPSPNPYIPPLKPLSKPFEDHRSNSIFSSFQFAGLESRPSRITHLRTRRTESITPQQRLIRPDPRLWKYSKECLQRRKQRYWGYRRTTERGVESPDIGLFPCV